MQQIVYISCPESQQIYVFKMDIQGILKLLQIVNTIGYGHPIAIHPSGTHLYIGIRPNCNIASYRINEKGLLTQSNIAKLAGNSTQLITDFQGKILYSVSYSSSCLSVNHIEESGIVGLPIQTLKGLPGCHSSNIDITNKVLWVPCLKENSVRLYSIDKLGFLTTCIAKIFNYIDNSGPRHMVFHHEGYYAYLLNELSSTISVIAIGEPGISTRIIQTLDILPSDFCGIRWASDIHITNNSYWLYCCDRSANIISCFAISKNGKDLCLIGHQKTETQPRSFNIDNQGKFLIVAGQKSNYISVYSIDQQSGALMILRRYRVGQGPVWVSILSR